MKKKWFFRIILAVAAYILLLQLLVFAESFSADGSIRSLSDAIWFSLVTLTTVGYGDFFPVTMAGRMIGIVFLLASTGLLTFLIGVVFMLATHKVFPLFRLSLIRHKSWYIFSELNAKTLVLAEALHEEQRDRVFIFLGNAEEDKEVLSSGLQKLRYFCLALSLEQVLKAKGRQKADCYIYFMGDDSYVNYREGCQAVTLWGKQSGGIYCQTEYEPERLPVGFTIFNRYDSAARLYWRQNPLAWNEQCIVLVGCGRYGTELMERALAINVFGPLKYVEYHVVGDSTEFRRNHTELGQVLELLGEGDGWSLTGTGEKIAGDLLYFEDGDWNQSRALLERADRIILCMDSDEENLAIYRQLKKYFAVAGTVHMRLSYELEDVETFGQDSQLYIPELVMRTRLNQTAILMNEIYRKSASYPAPTWEGLSEFLRQSNISAAEHLLTKLHILLGDNSVKQVTAEICEQAYQSYTQQREEKAALFREIEHERWLRFYALHNWRYDPVRNNQKRLHPSFRRFEELAEAEQAKDDYAWELLGELAKEM